MLPESESNQRQIIMLNAQMNRISSAGDKAKSVLNADNSNQRMSKQQTLQINGLTTLHLPNPNQWRKLGAAAAPAAISTQKETAAVKNNTDQTDSANSTTQENARKAKTKHDIKQAKVFMSADWRSGCEHGEISGGKSDSDSALVH